MNINVDMDPNLRWCPRNGCLNYVRRAGRLRRQATCECGQQVCMKCGAAAHGWTRCANVGDAEFMEFAKNANVKPCPNCRIPTDKYTGCNHVTCHKCSYEWCWICFGNYNAPGRHYGDSLFRCPGKQYGDSNYWALVLKMIAAMIFVPPALLIIPIVAGFVYPWLILCNRSCPCLINLVLFCILLPLGIAAGVVVGCLAIALLTIPIELT